MPNHGRGFKEEGYVAKVSQFCNRGGDQPVPDGWCGKRRTYHFQRIRAGQYTAKVTFDISGSNLLVTLTNTSTADIAVAADLLTAVFFNITGDPLLTRNSVVLAPGSSVEHGGGTNPGNDVGSEFAYLNGLNQYGANQGISNSGLGLFGPGDLFPVRISRVPGPPTARSTASRPRATIRRRATPA